MSRGCGVAFTTLTDAILAGWSAEAFTFISPGCIATFDFEHATADENARTKEKSAALFLNNRVALSQSEDVLG
jgi:hypothetical protein